MIYAMYLLGFVIVALLARRTFRQALEDEDDAQATTPWRLSGSLTWIVLMGLAMVFFFLRALIRGEVDCYMKGGRCEIEIFVRTLHPREYWFNTGFFAVSAAVLFWVSWRIYRRWQESHR